MRVATSRTRVAAPEAGPRRQTRGGQQVGVHIAEIGAVPMGEIASCTDEKSSPLITARPATTIRAWGPPPALAQPSGWVCGLT